MLLRSSSTPILGSLFSSSLSETPSNNFNHYEASPTTLQHSHSYSKLPFCQTGSLTASCNSSPVISPSINGDRGFQRAKSEDNLEGNSTEDHFCETIQPKMFPKRPKCLMLQTIPSFSFYNSRGGVENEEEYDSDIEDFDEDGEELDYENEKFSQRKARGGDIAMTMETAYFCLEGKAKNMSFTEEARVTDEYSNVGVEERNELEIQRMYLSKLLGIGCNGGRSGNGGGGGGGDSNSPGSGSGGDDGDKQGVEEYYKKMVEENPGDPLFLRNYAQFLYQSKGDLRAAEEFYSRAILADPKDGDILSQYAKLVWELHHDLDRAASYFERAVRASPLDNFVQAAYANFLWDTEEDGEDDLSDAMKDLHLKPAHLHGRAIASAAAKKLCYGRSR